VPDPFSQETRGFGEWGGILARSESLSRLAAACVSNFRPLHGQVREDAAFRGKQAFLAQKPTGPALGRPCWCCPVEQNYLLFFFAVFLAAFLAAAFFFLAMVWLPLCYA
jgi:hypothetical protein